MIGVSQNRDKRYRSKRTYARKSPSMAQIVGQLFNSAFIDALEGDLEHLERINSLIDLVPEELRTANGLPLRPVDNRVISPSRPVDGIAGRQVRYLPKSMRFFLRAIGATAKGGGATAASYLLFHESFIHEMMELGYQDTMWEAESLKAFFGGPNVF